MRLRVLFPAIFALATAGAQGPPTGTDRGTEPLERRIANPRTRAAAIADCASDLKRCEHELLAITSKPGDFGVFGDDSLAVGLADTFGALRLSAGIPFLMKNIDLTRDLEYRVKYADLPDLEHGLPAVGALVRIGAPAGEAVASRGWDPSLAMERYLAIYVVSKLAKAGAVMPSAFIFLSYKADEAKREREAAEEGLAALRARESGGGRGENQRPK